MPKASHLDALAVPRIAAWRRARLALRGSGWWYFCLLPLVGVVGDPPGGLADLVRVAGSVVVAGLCLAYAYGFNGITDRAMDRDQAKNSLAGLVEVPAEAAVLVAACAVVALAIAAALTPVALAGTGVSLVAATLYSAQPRLKAVPVVGTFVNGLIFVPLPFLAALGPPSAPMLFLAYCFYALVTQNQILHEISDSQEDAVGGVRTTGVVVGPAGVRVIAVVLGPVAALLLARLHLAGAAAVLAAAVGLCGGAVMVALGDAQRARQLRVAHRWYALVVGAVLFALVAWGSA